MRQGCVSYAFSHCPSEEHCTAKILSCIGCQKKIWYASHALLSERSTSYVQSRQKKIIRLFSLIPVGTQNRVVLNSLRSSTALPILKDTKLHKRVPTNSFPMLVLGNNLHNHLGSAFLNERISYFETEKEAICFTCLVRRYLN